MEYILSQEEDTVQKPHIQLDIIQKIIFDIQEKMNEIKTKSNETEIKPSKKKNIKT